MKKINPLNQPTASHNHIPEVHIIDLEHDGNSATNEQEENISSESAFTPKKSRTKASEKKTGIRRFLNLHVLLLLTFIIFATLIYVKFKNWGEKIDLSEIPIDDSEANTDILDQFLPLVDSAGQVIPTGNPDTIVAFGNAPFSDHRGTENNLANMIAKATGATVYNCSVSNSYLACQSPYFNPQVAPMDIYSFYWLICLATLDGANSAYFEQAAEVLGDAIPPEAQEVYDTLTTLDFNTVDVVTIMYDASDYLMGHGMYSDENPTDIQQFTGNLEAGIELLQKTYPHIRIIVMSPTYAYALDEEGNYISSDKYVYGEMDVLSTYSIRQCMSCLSRSVSFVDHLYGTVNEDNATEYLVDHVHLNQKARELITRRFMDALTRNGMEK